MYFYSLELGNFFLLLALVQKKFKTALLCLDLGSGAASGI